MGPSEKGIDAWLHGGGLLVTASDRAARALAAAFHRGRRAEGLLAWPAPNIQDWNSFVRAAWEERALEDPRLLLNPVQEQAIWAEIAGSGQHTAALLEGPRHRLAALAVEAHELLAVYAPRLLSRTARTAWQQDAAAFSDWLNAVDEACSAGSLLSPARLPLELIPLLESEPSSRPPLLLAGFDRILPIQRALFDAWGDWHEAVPGDPAQSVTFYEAPNAQSELAACALWCGQQLAANPQTRLLVVTQDTSKRRGEIERAFLHGIPSPSPAPRFEFSLGVPLSQVALPKAAHLLLRWLTAPLAEHELDWLFSTGYAATGPESSALQATMRQIRRRGQEQPQWTLRAFASELQKFGGEDSNPVVTTWLSRFTAAQRRLADLARRPQSPLDWAELVSHLLESLQFANSNPLQSAEHQAFRRWQQTVDSAGSLGFDGRRVAWPDFLSILAHTLDETLFAPESRDAPIQIAGPAESAGLTADAVWFLGATEEAWPASGSTHPLLPPEVQRQAAMPHATPQLDWDLAQSITIRLLASARQVNFSYARQNEAVESRPSRLIAQFAGPPQPLPPELTTPPSPPPLAATFQDFSRIPFPPGQVQGGASVLTYQSQCPFKAFATARLGAQSWNPAEAGLTPAQRGNLLHEVLHSIWAGLPDGIRSLHDLQNLSDGKSFVVNHVQRVLQQELSPEIRYRMPRRYLELEAQRLTTLITEWLGYEATRVSFEVAETEASRTISLEGLLLKLRLDRIDRLCDGSLLVIDYKSGNVSPSSWDLPRPDDVQLPLYAGFALEREKEPLGGLVFAKVRPGDQSFAGRVFDPASTLLSGLGKTTALVKNPLSAEDLIDWRNTIEQLARDFLAGRAEVDPRDYPKTCERCGLQTLCRIQESQAQESHLALGDEDESEDGEAVDE
jgi:probable DNA repair protein